MLLYAFEIGLLFIKWDLHRKSTEVYWNWRKKKCCIKYQESAPIRTEDVQPILAAVPRNAPGFSYCKHLCENKRHVLFIFNKIKQVFFESKCSLGFHLHSETWHVLPQQNHLFMRFHHPGCKYARHHRRERRASGMWGRCLWGLFKKKKKKSVQSEACQSLTGGLKGSDGRYWYYRPALYRLWFEFLG